MDKAKVDIAVGNVKIVFSEGRSMSKRGGLKNMSFKDRVSGCPFNIGTYRTRAIKGRASIQ